MKAVNLNRLAIIPFLLFTYGCVSTSHIKEIKPINISGFSLENINGNYRNAEDSSNWVHLWNLMNEYYPYRKDTISKNAIINISFNNNGKLFVTAIEDNIIIDRIELKTEIEGDYLSVKRKFFLIPIPFFLIHKESKILIGLNETKYLIVKSGAMNDGWILFFAGGNTELLQSFKYRKIEK